MVLIHISKEMTFSPYIKSIRILEHVQITVFLEDCIVNLIFFNFGTGNEVGRFSIKEKTLSKKSELVPRSVIATGGGGYVA